MSLEAGDVDIDINWDGLYQGTTPAFISKNCRKSQKDFRHDLAEISTGQI
jgi:hypothetical protein